MNVFLHTLLLEQLSKQILCRAVQSEFERRADFGRAGLLKSFNCAEFIRYHPRGTRSCSLARRMINERSRPGSPARRTLSADGNIRVLTQGKRSEINGSVLAYGTVMNGAKFSRI
jgi:hypothetical protein